MRSTRSPPLIRFGAFAAWQAGLRRCLAAAPRADNDATNAGML